MDRRRLEPIPCSSRPTSTTRWSPIAAARPPWNAAASWGACAPRVSSFHPLRNADASETRYDADPRDLIEAVIALRARGAEILAIYHSHPRWAAIPSRTDLSENYYGDVPRIIVSLLDETPEVRVWRLDPDSYEELPWERDDRARRPALNRRPRPATLPLVFPEDETGQELRSPPTDPRGARLSMQRTLIIFKPDCVQRRLVGRDPRAVRGQGAADRRPEAHPGRPRPGREALRRAPGQAVLRRPDRLHHRRPGRRRRPGGERGDRGRPEPARGDQRDRRRPRDRPRRLLDQQAEQPGPRQRQPRVGRARDRPLVPARGAGRLRDRRQRVGLRRRLTGRAACDRPRASTRWPIAAQAGSSRTRSTSSCSSRARLFVVTALAYLVSPYVAQRAADRPGAGPGPGSLAAGRLARSPGPTALAIEFAVMLVSGLLAMVTDRSVRAGKPWRERPRGPIRREAADGAQGRGARDRASSGTRSTGTTASTTSRRRRVSATANSTACWSGSRSSRPSTPSSSRPTAPPSASAASRSRRSQTVTHAVPMLSIDNTYNDDEVREWDARVRKGLNPGEPVRYVVELKVDGVAVSLRYEEGQLRPGGDPRRRRARRRRHGQPADRPGHPAAP